MAEWYEKCCCGGNGVLTESEVVIEAGELTCVYAELKCKNISYVCDR